MNVSFSPVRSTVQIHYRRVSRSLLLLLLLAPGSVWADNPSEASALKRSLGSSGQGPVLIKSKTLTLDAKKRVFTYRDNVEIVRDDLNITANTVVGNYDENDEIKLITCEGNVVITRGLELRATSNRASYDVPRGVITMTEGPELTDKGNVLNADKVTIYVNEDRSEAEGNVRVKVIKASSGSPLSSGARKK